MSGRSAFAAISVLWLCACKPAIPSPAPPSMDKERPAPLTAPARTSDFSGDFDLAGTEPFWSVRLRGGVDLTLTRPEAADVAAKAPGAEIQPGQAVWRAATPEGAPMTVTLRVGQCSDGMSDRTYPLSAEVAFANQILIGCADRPRAQPRS